MARKSQPKKNRGKKQRKDMTIFSKPESKTATKSATPGISPAEQPPSSPPSLLDAVVALPAESPERRPQDEPSPLSRLLQRSITQVDGAPKDNAPHLIVKARAGTGKTTTLVCGLKVMKGIDPGITPSPQQKSVWDSIGLSKDARSVCFVAFNKSIAVELQKRVPPGCDAMTMHSLGFKAVNKALGRQEPNSYVVQDIIAELLERDIRWLRTNKPVVLKATEDLVGLCKMNLVPQSVGTGLGNLHEDSWGEELSKLASYYDIDLNGCQREVFELVPKVLERCKQPKGRITFDDMIWLPVVLNLPVFKYDLLLIDEAQDLNKCQQALAKRAGNRLVFCGDEKQAIYGFAGADCDSLPRLEKELAVTERKCEVLPLTVTRRCGKAIVKEAQRYVPDFEAFDSNPEGRISHASYTDSQKPGTSRGNDAAPDGSGPTVVQHAEVTRQGGDGPDPADPAVKDLPDAGKASYSDSVKDGDMVLCRVNAPLVSQCFRFLKAGRKANIIGRDVGQGLISTINKMKAGSVVELVSKLDHWLHSEQSKENAKRFPNEARLIALQDRYDCLVCFTDGANTVEDVIKKVETVFTDNRDSPGIRLSSVHKSKGLEARTVFILQPKGAGMPHPMARSEWQRAQEYNILYVAITRCIEHLVYVS